MSAFVIILIILVVIILALMMRSVRSASSASSTRAYQAWSADIETLTRRNEYWREVIYTSDKMQIALMSVPPGAELGAEVHKESDQFFRVDSGKGKLVIGKPGEPGEPMETHELQDGYGAVVPHGAWHNIINTSTSEPLKLYTIYSPPHHPPGTRDLTYADEIAREHGKKLNIHPGYTAR